MADDKIKIVVVGDDVYFGKELSSKLRNKQREVLGWMVLESLRRRKKGVDDRLYVQVLKENIRLDEKTLLRTLGKLAREGVIQRTARALYRVRSDIVYISEEGRLLQDVQPYLF